MAVIGILWLFACTGAGSAIDRDGDGADHLVDCDDADASRYPGATERCDGIDEDCDGAVDEDAAEAMSWYADDDGDGYGETDNVIVDCAELPNRSPASGDCDDADADVNPGALERCDGVDEDCDGTVDDDAIDATIVYTDADGDGYGDDATAVETCAGEGVVIGGDCDDEDAAILPGAEERCDGIDTDCDGQDDAGAIDGTSFWPDGDGDGYGDANAAAEIDCAADGRSADRFDCDDDDPGVNPADGGCALSGDLSAEGGGVFIRGADAGATLGAALLIADLAPDGGPALVVGAPEEHFGVIYSWLGPLGGAESLDDEAGRLAADDTDAGFGAALGAGDLDGDGATELVVGAPDDDDLYVNGGAAWIFPDATDHAYLGSAQGAVKGGSATDYVGTSLALGDATGDGQEDILVGGPGYATGTGRSYLIAGPIAADFRIDSDTTDVDTIHLVLNGKSQLDQSGATTALTDLDGDGVAEIIVGAPAGEEVYVVSGENTGYLSAYYAEAEIGGRGSQLQTGASLATPGDVDGDGYADLVVGGPPSESAITGAGEAWVIQGPIPVDVHLPTGAWLTVTGDDNGDRLGAAVGAGDIDGDGALDIVIGAPGQSREGDGAGAVYVLYGPTGGTVDAADADATIYGYTTDLAFGAALALGDLDGDGRAELAVGAPGESLAGVDAGGVFVFPGAVR